MYDFIRIQYQMGRLTAEQVRAFTLPEQAEEIVGAATREKE